MGNRHAFLIIAHGDFNILQTLIYALDDEQNDIYVHIDKKVKTLPSFNTEKSSLYIIDDRVDVRWGNYSQIICEYLLWETALNKGSYRFYHLISGVHLPLRNQAEIHSFFEKQQGMNLFCNLEKRDRDYQEILKLHRLNFFTRTYASKTIFLSKINQILWKSFIAFQRWMGITINDNIQFYWANNWCSLSHEAVEYLVKEKKRIVRRYRWSFCGDEWFAPTELMNSDLREKVINSSALLYGSIGRSNAPVLSMDDFDSMIQSGCIFARKFTEKNMDVVERVLKTIIK